MTPTEFRRWQDEKRAERVWLAGEWAADDARWAQLTGQRWPQPRTVVELGGQAVEGSA